MKTLLKSMLAAVLCAAMITAGISTGAGTACAASKKAPLKVVFDKKAVNLIKDLNTSTGRGDTPKLKKLEEKWGSPSKKKDESGMTTYTWKKGKTSIEITDYDVEKGGVGSISINIEDKNGSLCGVKTGMKKDDAIKNLQKSLGKKAVSEDGEYIMALTGPYMPVQIGLSDGKVSSITWFRS